LLFFAISLFAFIFKKILTSDSGSGARQEVANTRFYIKTIVLHPSGSKAGISSIVLVRLPFSLGLGYFDLDVMPCGFLSAGIEGAKTVMRVMIDGTGRLFCVYRVKVNEASGDESRIHLR